PYFHALGLPSVMVRQNLDGGASTHYLPDITYADELRVGVLIPFAAFVLLSATLHSTSDK
ncbi:MAG TPA: hypothetical protein VIE65_07790, partial [Methylobacter sp.]